MKIKEEIDKIFINIPTGERRFKEIEFTIVENNIIINSNCDTENKKEEIEVKNNENI